jgi:PmbA protein
VSPKPHSDLLRLAESLILFAKANGADEVEVGIGDGREFNVDVRLGQIENLIEAGSRSVGLKIIKDQRTVFATSSDLSDEVLRGLIKNAIRRAEISSRDEFAGLPPLPSRIVDPQSLELYDPEVARLDSKAKIRLALETERIGLDDPRITNSHGASFTTNEVRSILANSNGFLGEYEKTYCSLDVGLQAGDTDHLVEDFWYSSQTHFRNLETPEEIAKKAIERTVRQLNPRKIRTQKVPVIFEPMRTSGLLAFLFSCVSGVAIYQKASFLLGKLGQRIGDGQITVIDDGLLPGKLGSGPFDSEGVPSQRTVVVEKGILKNYLCHTYAARKLKLSSTGNAEGNSVSPNNFYLEPGMLTPAQIISSCEKGLLLSRTLGHGFNPVNGDISRGAFGLWIEHGEIAFPVSEITISGNFGTLLNDVEMIGNDLEFRDSICGPTIKVREMLIAGSD